ncbi:permease-like cell division protein FtsX [Marinobacterium sedimentorum]|uniref:permease-like cell division protein FtsX n=1 Tax=Marinobacterium sedimentorum TaxID=2927804 RepID=UPI0020C5E497|nr:permease-like cell division protein FtsX [Marinobacterium sedimentorum]MCP8686395.1 permease-like cell division protein FtsX [Marinobacterium sedimentorum]
MAVDEKNTPRRGAQQDRIDRRSRHRNWRRHHALMARQSWSRLFATPLPTLITLAVLAIALALPGFLLTGLKNVQQLSEGWDHEPRISLYLSPGLDDAAADRFSRELLLRDDLAAVDLISRAQGLLEFRELSRFGNIVDLLDENPLPAVITVQPLDRSLAALPVLKAKLQALEEVDEAALDLEWLQRLSAFVQLTQRAVMVLGLLLAMAVLLVVGNTIRVSIESRRDEIIVAKLVGGTDAWVRRPFLYTGAWYGLLGAALAWCLIQFSLLMLKEPVAELARLYLSDFEPMGLGLSGSLILLLTSLMLGWLGAWLAVGHHLRQIEPS